MTTPPNTEMTPGQAAYEARLHSVEVKPPTKSWKELSVPMKAEWKGIAAAAIAADPVRKKLVEALKEILKTIKQAETGPIKYGQISCYNVACTTIKEAARAALANAEGDAS